MRLRMISIDADGRVRVAVDGPITSESFLGNAENPLEDLLGVGWARHCIILDMAKADYIDSSAVGWMINCHKELAASGGSMMLNAVQPKVLRILKTLKIESIIPLVDEKPATRPATIGNAQ